MYLYCKKQRCVQHTCRLGSAQLDVSETALLNRTMGSENSSTDASIIHQNVLKQQNTFESRPDLPLSFVLISFFSL